MDDDEPTPPALLARRSNELLGEYLVLTGGEPHVGHLGQYPHVSADVAVLLRALTWLEAAVFAATDGERGPGPTLAERLAAAENALAARANPEEYSDALAADIAALMRIGVNRTTARHWALRRRLPSAS
jgi:hypothetical protein